MIICFVQASTASQGRVRAEERQQQINILAKHPSLFSPMQYYSLTGTPGRGISLKTPAYSGKSLSTWTKPSAAFSATMVNMAIASLTSRSAKEIAAAAKSTSTIVAESWSQG